MTFLSLKSSHVGRITNLMVMFTLLRAKRFADKTVNTSVENMSSSFSSVKPKGTKNDLMKLSLNYNRTRLGLSMQLLYQITHWMFLPVDMVASVKYSIVSINMPYKKLNLIHSMNLSKFQTDFVT